MKKEHDLKDCPFCGSKAELHTAYRKGGNGGCELYGWAVKCGKCGIETKVFDDAAVRDEGGIHLTNDGMQDAIAAWNNRTDTRIGE